MGLHEIDVKKILKCKLKQDPDVPYMEMMIPVGDPCVQVYNNFLTGYWRFKGQKEGQYPVGYLERIAHLFGEEPDTIEVCSRYVQVDNRNTAFTVDLDPDGKLNPSLRTNAETLAGIQSLKFTRSRGDPPYTLDFAKDVYHNDRLPDFNKILRAMARVTKIGGLVFMLVGQGCVTMEGLQRGEKPYHSGNLQDCVHYGLQRLGIIAISVVPNREFRYLNIYGKVSHPPLLEEGGYGLVAPEMVESKHRTAGKQASLNFES